MAKNKIYIDDGFDPILLQGARFEPLMEMPIIEKPRHFTIPSIMVPFSERNKNTDANAALMFYEKDENFAEVLKQPESFIEKFLKYKVIISPDCSLYRDAPFQNQLLNIYRRQIIGSFFQRKGCYVIPNARWGDERTYTAKVLPFKIAFLGIEKHSIISVGTYGCIQSKDDKYYFKAGLESMLETLEPEVVLVYGSMPDSVFGEYLNCTRFVQYDNWTKLRHGGER